MRRIWRTLSLLLQNKKLMTGAERSARLYEYNLKGGSLKWGQGKAGISPLLEQNEWELTFIKHQFCTWHVHIHSLSQILGRTGFSFYCHECLGTVLKLISSHQTKVYLTQKPFSSKTTDSEKLNSGYSQSWGRNFKEKPCKAAASLS